MLDMSQQILPFSSCQFSLYDWRSLSWGLLRLQLPALVLAQRKAMEMTNVPLSLGAQLAQLVEPELVVLYPLPLLACRMSSGNCSTGRA